MGPLSPGNWHRPLLGTVEEQRWNRYLRKPLKEIGVELTPLDFTEKSAGYQPSKLGGTSLTFAAIDPFLRCYPSRLTSPHLETSLSAAVLTNAEFVAVYDPVVHASVYR